MVLTFFNPMTWGKFKDVKGALSAAVKRAKLKKATWHMFRRNLRLPAHKGRGRYRDCEGKRLKTHGKNDRKCRSAPATRFANPS